MNINGKYVLITGASSGIGLATAKLLTAKGAKVALAARSKDKLEDISKSLPGSIAISADLSDENQVKKMIQKTYKRFGRIDILINNAGIGYDTLVSNIDTEKFRELFELNLVAPIVAMKEVIPIMEQQKKGVIINISSGTTFMNLPGIEAYASLKRALNGITLTGRAELQPKGISLGIVYPYITSSNFYKNKLSEEQDGDKQRYAQGDTPEVVAEKILKAIKSEQAETRVRP